MPALDDRLLEAAGRLTAGAARENWRGPDAYDGLWWRWPRPLVGGRRRRQAVAQLHVRSPIDIRRAYRRRHPMIAKALGAFGSVGLRVHRLNGDERTREIALEALELLAADRRSGDRGWGYPFDVQTRWSFYPAGSPNVVVTTFAASALLEAGRADMAARATAAAEWVAEELWVEPDGFFGYHPSARVNVHNASLLGAWLVHAALGEDAGAQELVRRAVERTLDAQHADGSFPYGEGPGLGWADSFHTGFVLTCLDRMSGVDVRIAEAVERGARQYERFFDAAGRATLWADKPYPEDAHSAGTGLTTLAVLLRRDLVDRDLVERVARRRLDAGLHGDHAVHRRYRWGRTTVSYMRWCDAHVALGCVDAAGALRGAPDPAPVTASV